MSVLMSVFMSGAAMSIAGLIVALAGAFWAAQSITAKQPEGAPPRGDLYIDLDKARHGLYVIGFGTLFQIIGALQAALPAIAR